MQKALRQQHYSSTSPRFLTHYSEVRWSKYFSPKASLKKTSQPQWCYTKHVKVHSPDRDTEYFDIVADVLQGDILSPYLFIIYIDYVLRTSIDLMKENSFYLAKEKSIRYPAQTITNADYADDIALLANTPSQAETMLHSLGQAAAGIGFHVNADKTEYMWFNPKGDNSTLKGRRLKLQ